jgi:Holliday junction DNA helicase RuvA
MISHVNGVVAQVGADSAVIEVGGVGLRVLCTPATLASLRPDQSAKVATSLVVREDSLTLYGFATSGERDVFEILQTASGVGPKLAQAMLAVLSPEALRRAVATEDVGALVAVPGIGRKGAQRIILELAGRLGAVADGAVPAPAGRGPAGAAPWRDQVRAGLMNLGWQAREADLAISAVEADMAAEAALRQEVDAVSGSGLNGSPSAGRPARAEGSGVGGSWDAGGSGADAGGRDEAVDVATVLRAALRKLSRA